jgi:hypothetical protein
VRVLRVRRGRDEAAAAVDCGRRKFATARKGSTIRSGQSRGGRNLAALDRFGGTGKSRMAVSPNHEIVHLPSGREGEELRQGCYNVRINVFHHEQGYPLEAEIDKLRRIWSRRRPLLCFKGYAYFRALIQTRRDG